MTDPWPHEVLAAVEAGDISALTAFKSFDAIRRQTPGAAVLSSDTPQPKVEEIIRELDGLIGMVAIKKLIREIYAFVEIQKRRETEQLVTEPLVLHMVFKGNPGTGKTTVARILGKIFRGIGVLPRGQMIEVERADLVGEYIGHTAQKTREQIKKACGGILFIDEAYSLARGGEKDFGKESIDVLVKAMEDHKSELILILAGYQREMEDFLHINPGLRSRFPIQIDFPDYSHQELLQIAEQMCAQRQYRLSSDSRLALLTMLKAVGTRTEQFGNARFIRNTLEQSIRRQAVRLLKQAVLTKEDLMRLEPCDLTEATV